MKIIPMKGRGKFNGIFSTYIEYDNLTVIAFLSRTLSRYNHDTFNLPVKNYLLYT